MTSSAVRISAKMVKLKQRESNRFEFQYQYFLYQEAVSIHKYGNGGDMECIRRIHLIAVPRAIDGPGTEVDPILYYCCCGFNNPSKLMNFSTFFKGPPIFMKARDLEIWYGTTGNFSIG